MIHERPAPQVEAEAKFQELFAWFQNAQRTTEPGERKEYILTSLKPDILNLVVPRFLEGMGPPEPISSIRNGRVEGTNQLPLLETYATWYEGLTYQIESYRDQARVWRVLEISLVYNAPVK